MGSSDQTSSNYQEQLQTKAKRLLFASDQILIVATELRSVSSIVDNLHNQPESVIKEAIEHMDRVMVQAGHEVRTMADEWKQLESDQEVQS